MKKLVETEKDLGCDKVMYVATLKEEEMLVATDKKRVATGDACLVS